MDMSAALDKDSMEPDVQCSSGTTSHSSTEISSILPLPSEIRSQTRPINEYSSAIMRDLTTLSQKLQKEVDLARHYVPKGSDYLKRVRNFVSTAEEKELYGKVRDQLIAVIHRSKNNAHCEKEANLSSEIRQTVDAIYKRLEKKLTVDEIRAEFKPFKNLFSQAPSVEDNELLFKAKMALIRALKDAEARENAAAWVSYGFQAPQHPSGMSHFLRSQIKCQIMNLTMKKDREAILTMGYKAAQAQNEQRLAQARKEFEMMLNEEPSQDKKEEKVVVDKEPVMTQPQADSQVIVKYLELKLQSRESEIDSLNVKLDEQTKRSEETISDLTGELEASKNREQQFRGEIEELKRNRESHVCSQLVNQNVSDYVNELTKEIYTTIDILNATQYEAIKLKMKCQNAEKLVQQMMVKIEFEEKENCKFRDEVVNLEAMIQNMQINDGEKAQELNTQIEKLEKDLDSERRQNEAYKQEISKMNTDYDMLQSDLKTKIEYLNEKAENMMGKYERKLVAKSNEYKQCKEEKGELVKKYEAMEKLHKSDSLLVKNLKLKISQQQEDFSSKLYAAEREIDQLTTEVYVSGEKVEELKEEINIETDENRKLIEANEDLKSKYALFQETANLKIENLEDRLSEANEALNMEQDKLKQAEESIKFLKRADIELLDELNKLASEKFESEKKLKSELKQVTESLEKSQCEVTNAAVLRQQLKDNVLIMEKHFNELVMKYNEKSKLLAEIQNEKKEKQMEKDELEEQGYELFEF